MLKKILSSALFEAGGEGVVCGSLSRTGLYLLWEMLFIIQPKREFLDNNNGHFFAENEVIELVQRAGHETCCLLRNK